MTDTGDRLPGIYPDTRDHAPPDADIVTDHDRLMSERASLDASRVRAGQIADEPTKEKGASGYQTLASPP